MTNVRSIVPSAPGQPIMIATTGTTITLQWYKSVENGYPISQYIVHEVNSKITDVPVFSSNCTGDILYYCGVISGLVSGTSYTFQVQASNYVGLSPLSIASSPGSTFNGTKQL